MEIRDPRIREVYRTLGLNDGGFHSAEEIQQCIGILVVIASSLVLEANRLAISRENVQKMVDATHGAMMLVVEEIMAEQAGRN